MRCYVKIHSKGTQFVIGVCDIECLGKKVRENKLKYHVSEHFFKDQEVDIDKAVKILKTSPNFNAVGKNIIDALIQANIIHSDGVITIEGLPIALKMIV
jgi:uncharacterized protein